MKIELLMWRNLVRRAEIDHILRTDAALGKGAGKFDVSIPGLRKFPACWALLLQPWANIQRRVAEIQPFK